MSVSLGLISRVFDCWRSLTGSLLPRIPVAKSNKNRANSVGVKSHSCQKYAYKPTCGTGLGDRGRGFKSRRSDYFSQ
jgi:hypothetical protein